MNRRLVPPIIALVAALALAFGAAAHAAIVPGQVIEPPTAALPDGAAEGAAFGGVAVAPDGTGGLVYRKKVGGKFHLFVSTLSNGAWSAPQQVENHPTDAAHPTIAAGNGGRLAIAYINAQVMGGKGALRAAVRPAAGQPFVDTALNGNPAFNYGNVAMEPGGTAYVVYQDSFNDVRAFRLSGTTWTAVGDEWPNDGGILNSDKNITAGDPGPQRNARVAVTPAGDAVAVWTEETGVGEYDVWVRRLAGTTLGAAQKVAVPSLAGFPSSLVSDMADVDVDGAGNAWIAFRQLFKYGGGDIPHVLVRPLVGDALGAPAVVDGLPVDSPPAEGAEFPSIDVTTDGRGLVGLARQLSFASYAAGLSGGAWTPGFQVNTEATTTTPSTTAAVGETGDGLIAYRHKAGNGQPVTVRARYRDLGALAGELELSVPGLGDATGLDSAADAAGNVAVGFVQASGANRAIVAAIVDNPADPAPPQQPGQPQQPQQPQSEPQPQPAPRRTPLARFGRVPLVDALVARTGVAASRLGVLALKVRNRNPFPVRGTAQLTARVRVAGGKRAGASARRPRLRTVRLGTVRTVTLGARGTRTATRTVTFRLTRAQRAQLRRVRRMTAKLTLTLRDPAGGRRTVVRAVALKAPARR